MKLLAEQSEKHPDYLNVYHMRGTSGDLVASVQCESELAKSEIMARINNNASDLTPGEWLTIKEAANTITRLLT